MAQYEQFEVDKKNFLQGKIISTADKRKTLKHGEILVKIDVFAYSANNITYAATGDIIRYWAFFPASEKSKGLIPVWGFANVIASNHPEIPVGDRIYGYFPPATQWVIKPKKVQKERFFEGAAHRADLPMGYNLYRRVNHEPHYSSNLDRERALLYPLFLTSFCLWDFLKENQWFETKQIITLSASSKTSMGLGYALKDDVEAPATVGITSTRHKTDVKNKALWKEVFTYDEIDQIDLTLPTVIVDMSGNTSVLAQLHQLLGDNMKFTVKVGLTHWDSNLDQESIIKERTKFFFAPSHIEKRYNDWGANTFEKRSSDFIYRALQSNRWIKFNVLKSLEQLMEIHPQVGRGNRPSDEGIIVQL